MTRRDRIAGCLVGAAIGDALGSAFEFASPEQIERHVGGALVRDYLPAMPGSLLDPREPGLPTDDTALALSVAHTIATAEHLDAAAFARGFLDDVDRTNGRFAEMFWKGGPGGATTRAFRRLQHGADPATCGHAEDGGNGTVMRGHPVGILPDRDEALHVAAVQSRVTHGHPGATAAARAIAAIVWDALDGRPPSEDLPDGVADRDLEEAWKATHRGGTFRDRLPAHLRSVPMSAWYTLAAAHAIALLFPNDPAGAIAAAAGSGGDTDTVACITGAIVGARYGIDALPDAWRQGLRAKDAVQQAVDALLQRLGDVTSDRTRETP